MDRDERKNASVNIRKNIIRAAVATAALALIIIGLHGGEAAVILNKAVNICFECIGLG